MEMGKIPDLVRFCILAGLHKFVANCNLPRSLHSL